MQIRSLDDGIEARSINEERLTLKEQINQERKEIGASAMAGVIAERLILNDDDGGFVIAKEQTPKSYQSPHEVVFSLETFKVEDCTDALTLAKTLRPGLHIVKY